MIVFTELELSGPSILRQLKILQLYGDIVAPSLEIITNALHYHAPMLEMFNYGIHKAYNERVMEKLLK